jgi:hypothetical protein
MRKLDQTGDHVLWEKLRDGPSGTSYYQLKPTENDANAAASMYIRDRFPADVRSMLESMIGHALVRSFVPPEPRETLLVRYVGWFLLLENATRRCVPVGMEVDAFFRVPMQGAGRIWQVLAAETEII